MGIPVNKIIKGKCRLFLYKASEKGSLLKKVIFENDFDRALNEAFKFIGKKEFYFVIAKKGNG